MAGSYVVVRSGETLTDDIIIDYCRSRLARYKAPRRVVFAQQIPTGLGGKVRRNALAESAD